MKIALSNIDHNPHRNMKRNPVRAAQVKTLINSFKRNGIWPNVVVRKHPTEKGRYQLAYGHNRFAAMKKMGITDSDFIVKPISDWGMYSAMVDENEAQRAITPELIMENVEAGIEYLEPVISACETVDEFMSSVEISTDGYKPDSYAQVRNNLINGQGLGVSFLSKVLPGEKSTDRKNIQAVVDSHYGVKKEQAKRTKAKSKRKAASAKRKAASAAKDLEEAKRLEAEAEQIDKEAEALMIEAKRLSTSADKDALLSFKNAAQMTKFAGAVKSQGIPRKQHQALAKHLTDNGIGSQNYLREIRVWWFKVSGRANKARCEAKRAQFKRKHKDVTLDDFAGKLPNDMRELIKKLDAVAPFAQDISNATLKGSIVKACLNLEHAAASLRESLNSPLQEVSNTEAVKLLKAS